MRKGLALALLAAGLAVSTAVAASGPGAGLQLGARILTPPPVTAASPWYVWDSSKCEYVATAKHPATYHPVLRKIKGSMQIGYMHYGNIDPFGVANSSDIEKQAKAAGFKLNIYNLKFPSPTEPLVQAKTSVIKKDRGVIEANQLPTLWTKLFKTLKEGCIPALQMYLRAPGVPSFGAVWSTAGTTQGTWLGQEGLKRHWDPAKTAFVECTNPDYGGSVNVMFDTAPPSLLKTGFKIPKGNIFKVVCKYQAQPSSETTVTDWFTAHPADKYPYVMINTIDDETMQGVLNAMRRSHRTKNVLTIANGADKLGQAQLRSGQQSASNAFFPEKYGQWSVAIMEDILSGKPVPGFIGTSTVVITKANLSRYYR